MPALVEVMCVGCMAVAAWVAASLRWRRATLVLAVATAVWSVRIVAPGVWASGLVWSPPAPDRPLIPANLLVTPDRTAHATDLQRLRAGDASAEKVAAVLRRIFEAERSSRRTFTTPRPWAGGDEWPVQIAREAAGGPQAHGWPTGGRFDMLSGVGAAPGPGWPATTRSAAARFAFQQILDAGTREAELVLLACDPAFEGLTDDEAASLARAVAAEVLTSEGRARKRWAEPLAGEVLWRLAISGRLRGATLERAVSAAVAVGTQVITPDLMPTSGITSGRVLLDTSWSAAAPATFRGERALGRVWSIELDPDMSGLGDPVDGGVRVTASSGRHEASYRARAVVEKAAVSRRLAATPRDVLGGLTVNLDAWPDEIVVIWESTQTIRVDWQPTSPGRPLGTSGGSAP